MKRTIYIVEFQAIYKGLLCAEYHQKNQFGECLFYDLMDVELVVGEPKDYKYNRYPAAFCYETFDEAKDVLRKQLDSSEEYLYDSIRQINNIRGQL